MTLSHLGLDVLSISQIVSTPYLEYAGTLKMENPENEDVFFIVQINTSGVWMGFGYSSLRAKMSMKRVVDIPMSIYEIIKALEWKIPEHSLLT